MTDPRLFRTPTSYAMSMRLAHNGTWTLVVDRKYEGEPWRLDDRDVYENLSLAEARDVVVEEVSTLRL